MFETSKPTLKLIDTDGNAFSILGKASRTLKKEGFSQDYIDQYTYEATSGDYDHLIQTTMKYFNVI